MDDNSQSEESSTSDDKTREDPFKVPGNAVSILKKNFKGNYSGKFVDQKGRETVDDSNADDSSLKKVDREKKEKKCQESSYPPGTKYGYKIPPWSKTPELVESKYTLSEIKNGVVLHKMVLSQPFYLFGRSDNNDVVMMNPTVSRHHAALQYGDPSGGNKYAWYLYDMKSSHGTFVNKRHRISDYTKLEDGFMFKLGLSVRFFLLDESVSMKENESSDEESRGVPHPSRREYKTVDNEEDSDEDSDDDDGEDSEDLFNRNLTNSLKQWFQNEGQDPVFIVEKLDRIFVCKIRLPLKEIYGDDSEDFEGFGEGSSKDEATYKAVNKCWDYLESLGVTPAGIKRTRDWKENEYYDSDEDPFFDRTGELEKKRLKRMKGDSKSKPKSQAEDHASLLSERENLVQYIWFLQGELEKNKVKEDENEELDEGVLEYQKTYLADLAKKKDELSKIDSRLKQLEKLMEESKSK